MRFLLISLCILVFPAAAQQVTDTEALALMLRDAARESAMRTGGSSVQLQFVPETLPPVVQQVFAEEQLARGKRVLTAQADADAMLTVEVRDMYSSTAPGPNSSYFRQMHATLGMQLRDLRASEITWSKELALSRRDTLDGAPSYETRDWLEQDTSWWDALLAPALITLTAGVIVLLLFTVRGSS
ncbi:hypothetical protein KQI65_09550 [bacterium]|nr:hypothetical protein [bacterium]